MSRAAWLGLAGVLVLALLGAYAYLWAPWRYFPGAALDHVAAPSRDVGLVYPSGREGIDYYGTLRMDLYIGADGTVDRVEVLESTVPESFRASAIQAFRAARYEPAVRYGRIVKSIKRVEVRFAPQVGGLR